MYNLIEFLETKIVAVVPFHWVSNNEVKWNDKLSPWYAKKGLFPKNEWKTFKIKIITSKIFETYTQAEKSMQKLLKLNITDVETDNIASDEEQSSESSLSSPEQIEPNMITEQTNTTTLPPLNFIKLEPTIVNENIPNIEIVNQNSVEMNAENYVLVEQNTLVKILDEIKNVKQSLKRLEEKVDQKQNILIQCSCKKIKNDKTRCSQMLPIRDISHLDEFENKLAADETLVIDLKKFLSNLAVTVKDLRSVVRMMVNKVYSLHVQGKINYTGTRGKKKIKNLWSTQIILQTISEVVPELILINDETEKLKKAEAELKYQLQHYYDRKRSLEQKAQRQSIS